MDKNKKIVIISSMVMTLIIVAIGVIAIMMTNSRKTDEMEKPPDKKEVASVVILDINPSIKLELDKDNKIINAVPLNDDAKEIIPSDLEGLELKEAVTSITTKLVEKGYAKEEIVILVNTEGEIDNSKVEEVIKDVFIEKNIEVEIIAQEISDTSKENASKYNITESKASYIEEIIKEKDNLSFEELKDKSIDELNEIKNTPKPTPTPTPTQPPKKSDEEGEVRKGSNYRCESIKEVLTADEARDKSVAYLNIANEDELRNARFGAQTTAGEYKNICVWETIIAVSKAQHYYYHELATGNYVGHEVVNLEVANYQDVLNQAKNYFSTNYGANPDDIYMVGSSGTITDSTFNVDVTYNGATYHYTVVKKTGEIRNFRVG